MALTGWASIGPSGSREPATSRHEHSHSASTSQTPSQSHCAMLRSIHLHTIPASPTSLPPSRFPLTRNPFTFSLLADPNFYQNPKFTCRPQETALRHLVVFFNHLHFRSSLRTCFCLQLQALFSAEKAGVSLLLAVPSEEICTDNIDWCSALLFKNVHGYLIF